MTPHTMIGPISSYYVERICRKPKDLSAEMLSEAKRFPLYQRFEVYIVNEVQRYHFQKMIIQCYFFSLARFRRGRESDTNYNLDISYCSTISSTPFLSGNIFGILGSSTVLTFLVHFLSQKNLHGTVGPVYPTAK